LLAEVAMAMVMLMIAMTLAMKVLGYVGIQRRVAEHRQRALLEVSNVMERLTSYPFDEVTADRARALRVSRAIAQSLPDAELAVTVADEQRGAGSMAKRVAVNLRWRGRSGEWEAPVRLTTWVEQRRPGR
jgi:hypothetical protein